MYRNCIFCSAALGSNESIEHFPVGRSLAFDGKKGRLWAVCDRCMRWNLAPIEERWEANEEAERLFRDARLRVQSENVGLAKLRDGTRLIRVGRALPGEMAAWRYGNQFLQRHRESAALELVGVLLFIPPSALQWMLDVAQFGWKDRGRMREHRVPASLSPTGQPLVLPLGAVEDGHLDRGDDGSLLFRVRMRDPVRWDAFAEFRDDAARSVLARALPKVNRQGANNSEVKAAVEVLAEAPSAEAYIRTLAANRGVLGGQPRNGTKKVTPTGLRALEMALHEEQERRAMDGELAALEAMWRQAEEIAAIADRLPDIPAPEPPRLALPR
jgi:hypothetical protein